MDLAGAFAAAWLFSRRPGFFETPGDRNQLKAWIFRAMVRDPTSELASLRVVLGLNWLAVLALAVGYVLLIAAMGHTLQFG